MKEKVFLRSKADGCCSICVDGIGINNKNLEPCLEIIKSFTLGDTFFLGFFRSDGINLTKEERLKYSKEIPEYFRTYGKYLDIKIPNKRNKTIEGMLQAAMAPVNASTFHIIPKVFHYYLETILFCPKIPWEEFVAYHSKFMDNGALGYVTQGYTDFLFSYGDSGDFRIQFNPAVYDRLTMYNRICQIVYNYVAHKKEVR
ncbi:MAG: hypothetical protein HFE66_05750 [Clostridiales bacterium]|nr:hypothetical protein [Clostridiales bacterium]